jgi:carbamoyl-phosphate synthase large subunit
VVAVSFTRSDGAEIRAAAVRAGIPCITTVEAAEAAAAAIESVDGPASTPVALQDIAAAAKAEPRAS